MVNTGVMRVIVYHYGQSVVQGTALLNVGSTIGVVLNMKEVVMAKLRMEL